MATQTFQSSGDLTADRRFEWARASAAAGDLKAACELLEQALELAPGYAAAWFALGEMRDRLGRRDDAVAAFCKARDLDRDDRHGAAVQLARLGALPFAPMPPAYVGVMFDQYAPDFERALLGGLDYRAPELLRDAVAATGSRMKFGSVLDLGSGTGLAGAVFGPSIDWLVGVDLSPGMLVQARSKGLYDRLIESDLLAFLNAEAETGARYHLIIAADVLMYLGEVAPLFTAVARVLARGGLFAFTAETHDGEGLSLGATLRYAHGAAYLRAALAAAGLQLISLESVTTRSEKGEPVPGLLAVAGH